VGFKNPHHFHSVLFNFLVKELSKQPDFRKRNGFEGKEWSEDNFRVEMYFNQNGLKRILLSNPEEDEVIVNRGLENGYLLSTKQPKADDMEYLAQTFRPPDGQWVVRDAGEGKEAADKELHGIFILELSPVIMLTKL
jgi:hypothetical protein